MLTLLLSPNGRISRSRFWLGFLVLLVLEIAVAFWLEMSVFGHNPFDETAAPLAKPAQQIIALASGLFVYPSFAVMLKRFHDRDKGWLWALPLLLVNVAGVVLDFLGYLSEGANGSLLIGFGVVLLLGLAWIVIELGCLRGTAGDNRFGPDPLALKPAA